jgi:hypothetical protein
MLGSPARSTPEWTFWSSVAPCARPRHDTTRSAQGGLGPGRTVRGGTTGSGVGLREWLATLEAGGHRPAATFDTRLDKPSWLVGSAARGAARGAAGMLRRKGFRLAVRPESFYVTATKGPLAAGELLRARAWGKHLGDRVSAGQRGGQAA